VFHTQATQCIITAMCNYRLYIFLGCGHSTSSATPVSYCANATGVAKYTIEDDASSTQPTAELATTNTGVALDLDAGSPPEPNITDQNQSSAPEPLPALAPKYTQPCGEGLIHPLHTRRLERMCTGCTGARDERLRALESIAGEIRIDPQRWQEKYREKKKERTSVEKLMLVGSRERRKVDSGVWSVGGWGWKG
jgi:hypothetical protein